MSGQQRYQITGAAGNNEPEHLEMAATWKQATDRAEVLCSRYNDVQIFDRWARIGMTQTWLVTVGRSGLPQTARLSVRSV